MTTTLSIAKEPPASLILRIREGLRPDFFFEMANRLEVPQELLARRLGLVTRTVIRRNRAGKNLSSGDSEKLMRVARIWNAAQGLFTSDHAIAEWLKTPASFFEDSAPLDMLDTDVGTSEVEGYIRGLEYGNFQ